MMALALFLWDIDSQWGIDCLVARTASVCWDRKHKAIWPSLRAVCAAAPCEAVDAVQPSRIAGYSKH